MRSLVSGVPKEAVVSEPFPHIVIHDAIDDQLCRDLIAEYPSIDTITEGAAYGSNERFSYGAARALDNPRVSPLWQEFVRTHTSSPFVTEVLALFEDHLPARMQESIGNPIRTGVRKVDAFPDVQVLLDAQICVNTPVYGLPSSVRGPHVDLPDKLFAGLFYLRPPGDDSSGGDLELFGFVDDQRIFEGQFAKPSKVNLVKTVKYERNVLVLFLNSVGSLHGVTPRAVTETPRWFFNLVAEVREPMFDLAAYQVPVSRAEGMKRHVTARLRSVKRRLGER